MLKERAWTTGFVVVWLLTLAGTIAFWGVVVWAIIKLVNANT